MKILVVTEQRQGKWNNSSFETLVAAQQIASATSGTVSAVVIGKGRSCAGGRNCREECGGSAVGRA